MSGQLRDPWCPQQAIVTVFPAAIAAIVRAPRAKWRQSSVAGEGRKCVMVDEMFSKHAFSNELRIAETICPSKLLETCAGRMIAEFSRGIRITGGCNGPHNHPETPLRNAAHWSIIFSRLYELTGKEAFEEAAWRSFSILQNDMALQAGRVPIMRRCSSDQANGVIGLAWLIEALVTVSGAFQSDWGYETARKLAMRPGFDWDLGFWKTCEPNGEIIGVDSTTNHQLWFAMALSMVPDKEQETIDRLNRFTECLPRHIRLTPDRLIAHQPVNTGIREIDRAARVVGVLRRRPINAVVRGFSWLHPKLRRATRLYGYVTEKEIGYHIFSLHAFARLKRNGVEFDNIGGFLAHAVEQVFLTEYQLRLDRNGWGYPYNPPGFEVPIVLMTYAPSAPQTAATIRYYYRRQLELTFSPRTKKFDRHNPDPETLTARLYTLSLLDPHELQLMDQWLNS